MDNSGGIRSFPRKRKHSRGSKEKEQRLISSNKEGAVVEVLCVHAGSTSRSSGFIVGERKVLTNARSVENYTQVKLRKVDSDDMYVARVLAIGNECDLALLTVDDDEFWKGVSPVEFGSLPMLGDHVSVVRYPKRRDKLFIARGIVSSINMFSYAHGYPKLLCLQMQTDTNLRNPGAPAFNDMGQCVGLSLPSLKVEYSDKIRCLIPAPVAMHFIQDYGKSQKYTGFPVLRVEWQNMQNASLRKAMGMTPSQQGIRVTRVDPTSLASQYLKPSDIILKFDDVSIGNDGTVPFWVVGRISFSYLVTQKYTGDTAVVEVLRESKVHKFNIELGTQRSDIPSALSDDLSS